MTRLFHHLRTRSRAFAPGLVLVLLATWLSMVCPQCLAQAQAAPTMSSHCQQHMPSPAKPVHDGHDCCQHVQASTCDGGSCVQVSAVTATESLATLVGDSPLQPLLLDTQISQTYPLTPPALPRVTYVAAPDPCPLYLRHCVFRN